jgi:hypothetical protein
MKHSCLTNTQEHANDWIASGCAFAMTKQSFTRLLVNSFTYLRMKQIVNIAISLLLLFSFGSCSEDYLNTFPTTDVPASVAFGTTETAATAINGLAGIMVTSAKVADDGKSGFRQHFVGAEGSIKCNYGNYPGNTVTAFGTTNYGISLDRASGNYHEDSSAELTTFAWWYYYRLISNANVIIVNIDAANGPESEKQRIKAQALVFRAYAYSMLVQIYAYRWTDSNEGATPAVVLHLKPVTGGMPLSTLADVYKQIYLDLDEAIGLFTASEWTRPSGDFWTPNINVAYATYARAAINKLDYDKAIVMAQKAREGYPLMTVDEYKSGFYSPNREWIWGSYQGMEQNQQWSGFHAYMGYNGYASTSTDNGVKRIVKSYLERIPATDIRKGFFLDPSPYPASAFDSLNGKVIVDRRHPHGATMISALKKTYPAAASLENSRFCSYMQFKIARDPASTSDTNVGNLNHFRSSEMYLIEAEAQFKEGNETRARELLVELTKNSGRNPSYECTKSGADLFDEIKFIAQIELWGEGFDWFMVKRWGDRIVHLSFADGGNFLATVAGEFGPEEKNKQTFVIPLMETDFNPLAKGLAQ